MYRYQETSRYFAQMPDDVKDIAEEELKSWGATDTSPAYRGIYFNASPAVLYAINFHGRLLSRVLAPLMSFSCHSDRYLYKRAAEINWSDFLKPSQTFACFATVSNSRIRHSKFAALRLKDAIADSFRVATGVRPSVDTKNPDIWINLHIDHDEAVISIDTSGGSLHRRGYRKMSVDAPMMETLAAAIIQYAEWDASVPLYDPFCGSGTLLCEAYMQASCTPAGTLRKRFGFQLLPDFDSVLWEKVRAKGRAGRKVLPAGIITGSDIDGRAVDAAKQNSEMLLTREAVAVEKRDAFRIDRIANSVIVCNPPYGIRLKGSEPAVLFRRLGDFLKQRCQGCTAFIYFGDRQHLKEIGLKSSWKKPLSNGGLDGRLAKYELY